MAVRGSRQPLGFVALRAWAKPWFRRYAPLELAGTISALAAAGAARLLTDEIAGVAMAATLGENLGYYGLAGLRELRWRRGRPGELGGWKRRLTLGAEVGRSLVLEFGPAEILDSLWIRPASIYLASRAFNHLAISVLAGKLAADLIFYCLAILGHAIERRRRGAFPFQEPSKP